MEASCQSHTWVTRWMRRSSIASRRRRRSRFSTRAPRTAATASGCRSLARHRHPEMIQPPYNTMHGPIPALLALATALTLSTVAAQEVVPPPESLILENVPAIPSELAQNLKPYGEFRPHGMLSWH